MAEDIRDALQRALRDLNRGVQTLLGSGSGAAPDLLARELLAEADGPVPGGPPPRSGRRPLRRGDLPRRTRGPSAHRPRKAHLSRVK